MNLTRVSVIHLNVTLRVDETIHLLQDRERIQNVMNQKNQYQSITTVVGRFDDINLFVNRNNYVFIRSSVNYRGHFITSVDIDIDHDNIKAIVEITHPRNIKHVRSFLQTCKWFRSFVPDFARVS